MKAYLVPGMDHMKAHSDAWMTISNGHGSSFWKLGEMLILLPRKHTLHMVTK
jgi:hypothetical protein